MTYYRAHTNLDIKGRELIPAGTLFRGSILMPESITILEGMEHISRVSFPPLSVLPGWKNRAEKLAAAGIVGADDFLDSDPEKVAKLFRGHSAATVDGWKSALLEMFTPPAPPKG